MKLRKHEHGRAVDETSTQFPNFFPLAHDLSGWLGRARLNLRRSQPHATINILTSGGLFMRLARPLLSLCAVAVLAATAASLLAEEKFTTPLIPREVLFGNPEKADP